MPRGIKKELGLADEIVGVDRTLLASIKKNYSLAKLMVRTSPDKDVKETLEKFLEKHFLTPKDESKENLANAEPVTEKDKHIYRLNRYLSDLTEYDIQNLLELSKSMYRIHNAATLSDGKSDRLESTDTDTNAGANSMRHPKKPRAKIEKNEGGN